MHCPSCGNESSLDQKFCRQCGFDLAPISKLLGQHADSDELDKSDQKNLILRRMFKVMGFGLLIVLLGVVLLTAKKGFELDKIAHLMATLFLLVGTALAGYSIFAAVQQGTTPSGKKSGAHKRGPVGEAHITKELPEVRFPVPVPSVTERTTQLIGKSVESGRDEQASQ
ncbi:MAG: zinc ribbon domain-containing protein [Acidobacteriota bacterium]